ncbi:hypothetical protein [Streptomyces sudanensis]|uniref:hypothetical protein n=1 Tax=Streptomyces sudanensis TaxID=436397 RepID=UPI0020CFDD56|nr:hypothetical protein [Streptomyces sudanensis]MCP9957176.1 hypothetical protein [Streptomyces sudanensis]MCQ0002257.1 hypothetical protein [Streptomyces sudanensis]
MVLASCGFPVGDSSGGRGERASLDMQQAAERADAMLDATFEAIVPEVEWTHDTTTAGSCDVVRRRTVLTVISDTRRGGFLGLVERNWKAKGYRITAVRPHKESPAVYAVSPDGFGIRLLFGYEGQAFFQVATPCVQESKVAESKTPPNGPTYLPGQEIPAPNVRSPFWSAGTPAPPSVRPTSAAQPSPSS